MALKAAATVSAVAIQTNERVSMSGKNASPKTHSRDPSHHDGTSTQAVGQGTGQHADPGSDGLRYQYAD